MNHRVYHRLATTCLVLCGFMFQLNSVSAQGDANLNLGATWLIGQQDDSGGTNDGAFPWTVGGGFAANTQGATALGLVRAFQISNDPLHLNAAIANGDFYVNGLGGLPSSTYSDGDPRFATHDMLFLEELAVASGNTVYSNFVQTGFWDKLSSASYGEGNNLDATGFGSLIVTNRNNQGIVELSPWDLSKSAIAAHVAGETTSRDDFMDSILAGLEMTTVTDNSFDLHGLAGAIWASVVTSIDLDPTAGRYTGADDTGDLVDELLNWQTPNGGFVFNSSADPNDNSNANTQVTAFALLALNDLDADLYSSEISQGLGYLRSIQDANGQFLAFDGAASNFTGGVETHGEALEAYASAVPEPSTMIVVIALGLGGILRRRRRRGHDNCLNVA